MLNHSLNGLISNPFCGVKFVICLIISANVSPVCLDNACHYKEFDYPLAGIPSYHTIAASIMERVI